MSGGRWRRSAEMVQPGPEAEPALAEALQRLRAENRELRGENWGELGGTGSAPGRWGCPQ